METLTRDDADMKYVRWILANGNTEFFIWQYLRRMTNNELAEHLEDLFPGEEFNVVDE